MQTTPGIRRSLVEHSERGLVVTSETIAQGAGLQHKNTLELISKQHLSLERFGLVAFETRPRLEGQHGGGDVRVALLNEQQATLLMTFMRNTERVIEFKVELVQAFYDMARQLADTQRSPMSEDDIVAQALQITSARVKALESKVAQDAPKVDYVDTFVADEDLITIRTLASDLKIGENELRAILLERKWIYKQESSRWSEKEQRKKPIYRYSAMADKKNYFHAVLAHDAPRFRGEVMHTLKLTPEGAVAVTRLINQMRRAVDSLKGMEWAMS
ncbi:phage regulatory protein/antirepressor Ant [Glutamicibacter nicotianae]|uniref:phage regulatory protein/antirepressor Ant n=1 Tax=Glutamicibacter nicotianae TaxID=37929 RepID=UPI00167F8803|nr:phage regulatory protein/antirepressor Ant [Glutamicibacter nicotianae]